MIALYPPSRPPTPAWTLYADAPNDDDPSILIGTSLRPGFDAHALPLGHTLRVRFSAGIRRFPSLSRLLTLPIHTWEFPFPALTSLAPLTQCPSTRRIQLTAPTTFPDLRSIAQLPQLEAICIIKYPGAIDLSPLEDHATLNDLMFYHCPGLSSIHPLRSLSLLALTLVEVGISDLLALKDQHQLTHLWIQEAPLLKDFRIVDDLITGGHLTEVIVPAMSIVPLPPNEPAAPHRSPR